MSGGELFSDFRKKVIQSNPEACEEVAMFASVAWAFLIGFAAKKAQYRRQILAVIQKLSEAPSWIAAWEAHTALHARVKDLHEDLQAALAVQHKAIAQSVAPSALGSMASVRQEERPELLRQDMAKEKMVSDIRETQPEGQFLEPPTLTGSPEPVTPQQTASLLQAGIDAAVAIDDDAKMQNGGLAALNELRIGCIRCAGDEGIFSKEIVHAPAVFGFLIHYLRKRPEEVAAAAEVMNQLMASASWSAVFVGSVPLKESLQELPEDVQVAFGLQHPLVLSCIVPSARQRVEIGDAEESVKKVAPLMQSIRQAEVPADTAREAPADPTPEAPADSKPEPPAEPTLEAPAKPTPETPAERVPPGQVASSGSGYSPEPAPEVAPPPPVAAQEWRTARTPQGHTYYFNKSTSESQWERPASLGGPIVFKVGDDVEVWSNSQNCWGKGKVDKVDLAAGKVVCDFQLPNGSAAKKELPAGHKDLRLASEGGATESFSPEEDELYKRLFDALDPPGKKKSAKVIADLLYKSGANTATLRQIWAVANPGLSQELEFEDFARCCRLVAHCQAMGLESDMVTTGERPLRVKLRTVCLFARPPQLPTFG